MLIDAKTVGFVFLPCPFENIAIHVVKCALTMRFVIKPVAFVPGTIRPLLNSVTMPHVSFPLAFVDCAIIKDVLSLLDVFTGHSSVEHFRLTNILIVIESA